MSIRKIVDDDLNTIDVNTWELDGRLTVTVESDGRLVQVNLTYDQAIELARWVEQEAANIYTH